MNAVSCLPQQRFCPASGVARFMASLVCVAVLLPSIALAEVYRWVDDEGVIHLSSEKPPPGVKAERLDIPGTSKRSNSSTRSGTASGKATTSGSTGSTSPAQVAQREAVIGGLRNRECVIALEALERKTNGAEATSADEIRRLQQTTELNCSTNPARRRAQEEQALQLRMANSPSCAQARDRLADMMAPDSGAPREQLRSQQAFVDEHCTPPVR
jgi:Domain of unknown function (DUF4124)